MSIAIVTIGAKQYKVQAGDTIYTEKLEQKVGEKVTFKDVLMVGTKIGTPFVNGASVNCVVEKHGKQPKIRIIKFKSKKHHYKRQGHRQPYTKLKVETING